MTQSRRTVATLALIAVAAAGLDIMKAGCCTSAQAQTQAASSGPALWNHNGSVVYLVAHGRFREFYYQKPRAGMLDAGVRPGSLLFRGEIENGQYSGTAYIFNGHCGQVPFHVTGHFLSDERIVLTGQVPRIGRNCRIHEVSVSTLEFKRVSPNQTTQPNGEFAPTTTPRMRELKPEALSTGSVEPAYAATAQPVARPSIPSQSGSVHIAGKGKYCKETAVRGYLDCFYASLDACQKHNKTANARCVPNPNSGT